MEVDKISGDAGDEPIVAVSAMALQNNKFGDTVDRIVTRVALQEGHEGGSRATGNTKGNINSIDQGPLTAVELSELSLLCTLASSLPPTTEKHGTNAAPNSSTPDKQPEELGSSTNGNGFAAVEGDQLVELIELLDRHVSRATGINLLKDVVVDTISKENAPSAAIAALGRWLKHEGAHKLEIVKRGLEAASIVIAIASTPDVDRRAMNEDAIQASITLMRVHMLKHLIPAFNQTGHLLAVKTLDHKANDMSPSKKRRRSSGANTESGPTGISINPKELKKVYKMILSTVDLELTLTDRLEKLVCRVPLDDQQILMLTHASIGALEIDCSHTIGSRFDKTQPAQQLQLASMALVTAAFRRYPKHRDLIIADIFPLMLRLPTGKRSMRVFPLQYKSVPAPQSLETLNTHVVTKFLASLSGANPSLGDGDPPHFIQMVTALILSLIQACAVRPLYESVATEEDGTESSVITRLSSGLDGCNTVADAFAAELLKRCARKGGASEFRPVLCNLVDDLLLTLLMPEYPAAELLLVTLTKRLHSDLATVAQAPKSQSIAAQTIETTYMNTAFDILGKIGAVEAKLHATFRTSELTPSSDEKIAKGDQSGEEGQPDCYCGDSDFDNTFWQICECCNGAYHGRCIGLNQDDFVAGEWNCDACRLRNIATRERRKYQLHGEDGFIDETYCLQHAYSACISHREGVPGIVDASNVHLARWIDILETKRQHHDSHMPPRRLIAGLLEFWDGPGPCDEPLTEEGTNRMIISTICKTSPLLLSFRSQALFALKLMSDSSPQLRKLSLKTIEKIVEGDPKLMTLPLITKAVSKRLVDEATSVREAALTLVGAHVVKHPSVANSFQSSLLECLHDEGVSVRKRAVRIIQGILTSNPWFRGRSVLCDSMLARAKDPKEEDAVRDLIYDLFLKLWLEDGEALVDSRSFQKNCFSPSPKSPDFSLDESQHTGTSLVTPTPPPSYARSNGTPRAQKRVELAAEQMMEVVRVSGTNEYLSSLLFTILHQNGDGNEKKKKSDRRIRRQVGRVHCDQIAACLLELLVSIDEKSSKRAPRVGKDLSATLRTLVTFAELAPQTVFQHIDTITPYLKGDNGASAADEAAIVTATGDIIHHLATALGPRVADHVASGPVAKDFVNIAYKFGMKPTESAIRAMSTLAQQHKGAEKESLVTLRLASLTRTFYNYLYQRDSVESFATATDKERNNVQRAIRVLGFICQYHGGSYEWSQEIEEDSDQLIDPKALDAANSAIACYRVFCKFLLKDDSPTKCAALQALSGLLMSQPRLMLGLEQAGLISAVMSDAAGKDLQLVSLQCWHRILLDEEKRIDSGKAKAKMERDKSITTAKQISGDQDGDATVFGGVLTNHSERLLEMTQSKDHRIRFAAADLLGVLLRQGQINPNEAIPFLFALQGDVDCLPIRNLALRLLMDEGEKRPDMLRQRVCAGVKQAYRFQRKIYPKKTEVAALVTLRRGKSSVTECVFSAVFKECFASSQKQRRGLLYNLLSLFEVDIVDMDDPKTKKLKKEGRRSLGTDIRLLCFVSQILAYLPYRTVTDPLFIIHQIGLSVTLQGSNILEQLACLLRPVGLASSDEYDDTNFAEDDLERAACSKFPSRTQEARALGSEDFDIQAFAALCNAGTALTLLLRLKQYLRELYKLSETRCLEYDPSAKERISDKGITKSDTATPFKASVPIERKSSSAVNIDLLLRQYAEFRQLMREESSISGLPNEGSEDGDEDPAEGDGMVEDGGETPSKKRPAEAMD